MPENPFRPAEQVAPKVKCLVYGQSGVGKTYLALTAPGKVAVIDTEGGTAFYAGRSGLSEFDVLPTKTFNDVTRAIAYLAGHPDLYETLVIDPVTVLYETLQDAAQLRRAGKRQNPDADLEMLDWQQIKRAYKTLMTDLVNLPMHVIVTARERDDTERRGNDSIKVGVKPDAEKSTPYYFDSVIRLVANGNDRAAEVSKDRTGTLPERVASPSFTKLFAKAIKAGKGATGERALPSDEAAAAKDANTTFADHAPIEPEADGGMVGIVKVGNGNYDAQLRQVVGRPGICFGFRLTEGRAAFAVIAEHELAGSLATIRDRLIGQRVTCYGVMGTESFTPANGPTVEYPVLTLTRISTPDGVLPAEEALPQPPEDVELVGEAEAETAPLGLVS